MTAGTDRKEHNYAADDPGYEGTVRIAINAPEEQIGEQFKHFLTPSVFRMEPVHQCHDGLAEHV